MSDQQVRITTTENGPFQVGGMSSITRLRDGTQIDAPPKVSLCRCGGSSNKPFCDGTHARNGFSGGKDPNRQPDQRDDYVNGSLTVHDNRGLCAHSGFCSDNLASVFRTRIEPFVDPAGATAAEIIAVIGLCPSGALSYSIDGVEHRDRGGESAIAYEPGGPYLVSGGCELVDVELPEGATTDHLALCRCGASQNKPFCSGKHSEVDFDEDAPDQ